MEWKEKGREARFLNVTCIRGKAKQRECGRVLSAESALDHGVRSSNVAGAQTSSRALSSGQSLLNHKLWLCKCDPQ